MTKSDKFQNFDFEQKWGNSFLNKKWLFVFLTLQRKTSSEFEYCEYFRSHDIWANESIIKVSVADIEDTTKEKKQKNILNFFSFSGKKKENNILDAVSRVELQDTASDSLSERAV